ncbi:glycoside hydrolase family 19 protein [Pannus brasiliensis CCIBt3594]|uniref:Glycoside hydrolase family 19 protein n=1 Tax=Pannus brasiliensis CCIBt3594 TaxID=1427578 RepID=A0AAW9R1J1_9CHRO
MSTLQEIVDQKLVVNLINLKQDVTLLQEIQTRLHDLNLYDYGPGDPDGFWGPKTENGIERFCESVHLDNIETGLFGPSFAEALLEAKDVANPGRFALPDWWQGGSRDQLAVAIAKEGKKQGITVRDQLCYIMATIQHETARTYRPIAEYGGKNTRYAPYYGRGYVQLTWKYNYEKYSQLLGEDFVKYPDKVMEPDVSLFIIVHGMINGVFTGKKLNDYITAGRVDFLNARRIINGTDKKELIASYAENWRKTTLF